MKMVSGILSGKRPGFDISFISKNSSINLLIFTEHLNATYYLYFHYALEQMAAKNKLSFATFTQKSIAKHKDSTLSEYVRRLRRKYKPHLVIFSRYARPYGVELINIFKNMGIPTLYHLDDYLLEIPDSLGEEIKKNHGTSEVIEQRKKLIGLADYICVPTRELAEVLASEIDNLNIIQTMPPHYCDYLINKDVKRKDFNGITIGYMGSKSHNHDLNSLADTILRILDENSNVRFEIFGTIAMPEILRKLKGKVQAHPVITDYKKFMQYLYKLNWDIGLAPLDNNKFNICKTSVKYLEYTACEISTIASDINVYNNDINNENGLLVEGENWYQAITSLIKEKELRKKYIKNAMEYCSSRYNIHKYNQQLGNLIDSTINSEHS